MLNWEKHDEDKKATEIWESYPSYAASQMTHAAHPVTTEISPGYDRNISRLKCSHAVEEWCDFTEAEPRRRGPAIAARLSGRAELFTERLDRDCHEDPRTGAE